MQYSSDSTSKNQSTEEGSKPNRSSLSYWKKWVKAARDNRKAKRHRTESKAAWCEYEKDSIDLSSGELKREDAEYERCYPAYWSASKTIEPAYYARTPKTSIARRFGVNDVNALTQSLIAERLSEYNIENSNFDEAMRRLVGDFLHADKASLQIIYNTQTEKTRMPLTQGANGEYLDNESLYEGEVLQDDDGLFYQTDQVREDTQRIYVSAAPYDEIIHTPDAKCWEDIQEIGYKFCLSREDAEQRFGEEKASKINWKRGKQKEDEEESEKDDLAGEYIEGFEIFCKKTKTVYWISEQYTEDILDSKPDPYGFKGFFPSTPFIIGSPPSGHLYPTPVYVQLAPTIKQLHKCYSKIFKLIDSIRRRALVDGTCPELLEAFDELDDREFIVVENLQKLVEKAGNLEGLIWYIPVQELVSAISELSQLDQKFSDLFDLWFGVPDVLKGVVDPLTTAAAEQIASGAAHDRFQYAKSQIQKAARDAIDMMLDLSLNVYSDEKIARITGYQYMTEKQQMQFPIALAALRSDEERLVRIDIETDSTSFVNKTQEMKNRNSVVQTVIGGLKEIGGMIQTSPEGAMIAFNTVAHALEGQEGGKDFIEEVKGFTKSWLEKAQTPPQGPPPPDYEQMKLQIKSQELALKESALQLKKYEIDLKQQKEEFKLMLEQQQQQFAQWLQSNYMSLDQYKTELQAQETAAEEQRLAKEADAKVIEASKPSAQEAPSAVVNISIPPPPEPVPNFPVLL